MARVWCQIVEIWPPCLGFLNFVALVLVIDFPWLGLPVGWVTCVGLTGLSLSLSGHSESLRGITIRVLAFQLAQQTNTEYTPVGSLLDELYLLSLLFSVTCLICFQYCSLRLLYQLLYHGCDLLLYWLRVWLFTLVLCFCSWFIFRYVVEDLNDMHIYMYCWHHMQVKVLNLVGSNSSPNFNNSDK